MPNPKATPYIDLSAEEWAEVAHRLANDEEATFILHSWAHTQSVSVGALRARRGAPWTGEPAGIAENGAIGRVSKAVFAATGMAAGECYIWNREDQAWSIGIFNLEELRAALARAAAG